MNRNLANWDRALRITVGLGLLSLTFVGPESWVGWIGLVPLVNGLSGYCPVYDFFDLSTRRTVTRGP